MKTRLIAVIIIGIILSAGVGYLYDQMYDCLFPPMWMKIPRSYSLGDCLQMYADGTLPDWTKAREDHAEKQARNMELIERYKDTPQVIAFYAKYDDANVSVGDDFVSYSAGNVDDFRVRMNLYFDENYDLDYIDFHCYVGKEPQTEVPETFILKYLEKYDCEKKSVQGQVEPEPVQITGFTALQICEILKIPCPSEPSFSAFYNSHENTTTFEYFIKLHKYDFTIDDKRICYTVDGLYDQNCQRLKIPIPASLDGNLPLLLSKTIAEWEQMSEDQLWPHYEKYGDDFFIELGKFLIKNEMKKELDRNNIVNKHDDFTVFSGMMLTSLPPHVGYQAVVNATNGKSYLLEGSTFSNTIERIVSEELIFYDDVLSQLSADSLFSQKPLVTILPEDGNKARSDPHDLVINLDEHNTVTFYNTLTVPIRIQDSGSGKIQDQHELDWLGPLIAPNQTATVSFNATGNYEWDARFPPEPFSDWWGSHTGGDISVISHETNNLGFQEKLKIAGSIIKNSEIPWTGLGMGNNRGLTIDFNSAIFHMLPDAKEYYTARAHQLIPFDVPVIIEEPEVSVVYEDYEN